MKDLIKLSKALGMFLAAYIMITIFLNIVFAIIAISIEERVLEFSPQAVLFSTIGTIILTIVYVNLEKEEDETTTRL